MKPLLKLTTLVVISISSWSAKAQDANFSQFSENYVLLNPALMGMSGQEFKVNAQYRNQWSSIGATYAHMMVSGEFSKQLNRSEDVAHYGFAISNDKAGAINMNRITFNAALSYNKKVSTVHNSYLSLGFVLSNVNRSVDMGKMTFANQYINGGFQVNAPSRETINDYHVSYLNIGSGIGFMTGTGYYNRNKLHLGLAAYNLLSSDAPILSDNSVNIIQQRYVANAGYHLYIKEDVNLQLLVCLQKQQAFEQTMLGFMYTTYNAKTKAKKNKDHVIWSMGMFYRMGDAIIPTVKFVTSNLTFGISYDAPVNKERFGNASFGTTEVSMCFNGMLLGTKKSKK